jgi:antitoxin component of MazEF toxin-antitoxin module
MPIFKSRRKVQEFGSSLAITLPAFFVKANEIEKGKIANTVFGFNGILIASWNTNLNDLKDCLSKMLQELEDKKDLSELQ